MSFQPINQDMDSVTTQITLKTDELNVASEEHLKAEAGYDKTYASALLTTKLTNPLMTQAEIRARATETAYMMRMIAIEKESTYRRLASEIKALRDRLKVLQAKGANLRSEAGLG